MILSLCRQKKIYYAETFVTSVALLNVFLLLCIFHLESANCGKDSRYIIAHEAHSFYP